MKPLYRNLAFIACGISLALGAALWLRAQTSNVSDLRAQLRARYDLVPLQGGVGLVPHERNGDLRLIEIRNGDVAINGAVVTAREAREQLGKDADLIFRVTYLDAAAQRELTGAAPTPASRGNETDTHPEDRVRAFTGNTRDDLVRIFSGSVTVPRDEFVNGDVVAIGGSADVDGEVTGNVTVVLGSLNLGPDAIVHKDVAVVGGSLNRDPGARVDGKVDNVAFGPQFSAAPFVAPRFPARRPFIFRNLYSRVGGFATTILRMTLLILFGLVIVVLGSRFVDAIAERTAAEPLRSGLAGLLAEVLFVPLLVATIVVLAVSIIGIPLLFLVPFAIVLAVVLMIVGFTGVASVIGRVIGERLHMRKSPYISVALGIVAVVGITLIGKLCALVGGLVFGVVVANSIAALGYLVEYIAWTIGIGAIILTWLSRRRRPAPAAPVAGPTPGEIQPA